MGLWWIFDQNTEIFAASIGFASTATVLLQALIIRFWDWAATSLTRKRRLIAALFGTALSLASAGFASGSYIFAINKSSVEKSLTQQNASTVIAPLGGFSNKITKFSGKILNIANDTKQKSSIESHFGGTCAGDKPEKTCGPKCRMRQRQGREAEAFSKVSRSLANDAIDIIGRLQGDQSRAGMLQAFKAAHNLAADPKLSTIASWLRQQIAGFNGQFLDPETNRPFVCRDPEMVKRMSDALSLITSGFNLPVVPPEPVKIGFRDAIGKSYHDAFELAWMLLTGKSDPARLQSLSYSYAGYGPALAVEILIIALIFFRAASERDLGHGLTRDDLFNAHLRDLPHRLRKRYHAWVNLILDLLLEQGKAWYFARPVDGSPEIMRQCTQAVILLDLPTDPNLGPSVPLDQLCPEWVESRAAVHGGARRFVLHPLTKEKRKWLRRAARDLSEDPPDNSPDADPDPKVINLPSQGSANARAQRSFGWTPILSILLVSMVAVGLTTSRLSSPPRSEHNPKQQLLRVKADEHGQFRVTIDINGTPIRALLDTGATNLMLAYQDARQLHFNPRALHYGVRVLTANGETYAAPVTLADVRLGKIQAQNIKGLVSMEGVLESDSVRLNRLGIPKSGGV